MPHSTLRRGLASKHRPQGAGAGRDQRDPAGRRRAGAADHLHGDHADDRPRRQRRSAGHQPPRPQERRQQATSIVSINASGDVYVNADKVPIDRLTASVQEERRRYPDKGVFLKADHRIRYGTGPRRHGGDPRRGRRGRADRHRRGRSRQAPGAVRDHGHVGGAAMAFSVGTGRRGPQGEINVTPLIDIVLVLLIIFMVMTPVMLKELVAKVPQRADARTSPSRRARTRSSSSWPPRTHLTLNGEASRPRRWPARRRAAAARSAEGGLLQDRRRRQLRPRGANHGRVQGRRRAHARYRDEQIT